MVSRPPLHRTVLQQPGGTPGFSLVIALLMQSSIAGSSANAVGYDRSAPTHRLLYNATLRDIVEVKQIDSLVVSPDGRSVAYRVVIPSIKDNNVTVQWFRASINGKDGPIALGKPQPAMFHPLFDMVTDGMARWAPGGGSLYMLELEGSKVGIHRLAAGRDIPVTHDKADVIDFALASDGRSLSYNVKADRSEMESAQQAEDARGVRLDSTIYADGMRLTRSFAIGKRMLSIRDAGGIYPEPAFSGPLRSRIVRLPPTGVNGKLRADADRTGINPFKQVLIEKGALTTLRTTDGIELHLVASPTTSDGTQLQSYALHAALPSGLDMPCPADACVGSPLQLRQVLMERKGNDAIIVSDDNDVPATRIFGWSPKRNVFREIYGGQTSLDGGSATSGAGCLLSGRSLVCVESAATLAPRLVAIDLMSGKKRILARPNAKLALLALPNVRPIRWRDPAGRLAGGILVLPRDVPAPPPLVLTTYKCRGFLHGGTGMVTPELLLAERGIASLCVNFDNMIPGAKNPKGELLPLAQHRSEIAVYRAAIAMLAAQHTIDPSKVGISGHSFGAMIAAYAISHTDLFRAASLGTGVLTDPVSFYVRAQLPGSEGRAAIASTGLPPPDNDPNHLWADISAALNVSRISTPVLLQPPENEWLGGLQLYTALRDHNLPSDMYIFPNAGHMLCRYPAQQYWRALRSVDWFSYWLADREYPADGLRTEYSNWKAMRIAAEIYDPISGAGVNRYHAGSKP